jgi:hypothetical protein
MVVSPAVLFVGLRPKTRSTEPIADVVGEVMVGGLGLAWMDGWMDGWVGEWWVGWWVVCIWVEDGWEDGPTVWSRRPQHVNTSQSVARHVVPFPSSLTNACTHTPPLVPYC